MANDDRHDNVTNVFNGDAEDLIQIGHIGDDGATREASGSSGGSVTNVFNGDAKKVIQAGNIYGGIQL